MLLEDAIALAAALHAGQVDKAGKPYILHVLRVMQAVEPLGQDHMIVAVLHDVVEDTGVSLAGLRARGADRAVVDAVDALTKRLGETYREFIERCAANPTALEVKLADLRDNMDLTRLPHEELTQGACRNARYSRASERLMSARAAGVPVVEVEG